LDLTAFTGAEGDSLERAQLAHRLRHTRGYIVSVELYGFHAIARAAIRHFGGHGDGMGFAQYGIFHVRG
jgi:hypothetical protein